MSKINLTDLAIKRLPIPDKGQKTYFDQTVPGFGVRVSQGGSKTFVVVLGKNRTYRAIGKYPAISLKIARTEAQRRILAHSPNMLERPPVSHSEAFERFLAHCRRKNKERTVYDYNRVITRHFSFGSRTLHTITREDVLTQLNRLNKTPSEKHHAFIAIRAYFNWCVRQGLLEVSPVGNIAPTTANPSRDRILTDEELAQVYNEAKNHPYPFGPIVQLLILTGLRRSEVSALHKSWFSDTTLTVPKEFTKNRHAHSIPVTRTVLDLIEPLPDQLFGNTVGTTFSGWGKSKARFDKLVAVEDWTLHDLRRTFASVHAQIGTPIHVVEKLLNHISGSLSGVAGIYNRYSYLDEMRVALEKYEEHLKTVCA